MTRNVEEVLLELECQQVNLDQLRLKVDLLSLDMKQQSRLVSTLIMTLKDTISNDSLAHLELINSGAMM